MKSLSELSTRQEHNSLYEMVTNTNRFNLEIATSPQDEKLLK